MAKPVASCLQVVREAKEQVNKLLTGTEHSLNILEINRHFKSLETKLQYMGAVTEPELNGKKSDEQFPPMKSFMGKTISRSKRVTKDDLVPDTDERKIIKEKVQTLYDTIRDLTPDQVFKNYPLKQDQVIIRGVAKWAGVEDYDTREINSEFIEDIQLNIEEKAEQETTQQKIDKAAAKTPTSEVVLTQEAIDKDSNLQKMKAKEGDKAVTSTDGKVTLVRKK